MFPPGFEHCNASDMARYKVGLHNKNATNDH